MKRILIILLAMNGLNCFPDGLAFANLSLTAAEANTKNPFAEYGFDKSIMLRSASETVFEEFFNLEDTVELGGVYFNIRTYEIAGFIPDEKLKNEINVDLIALSVDPESSRYWWITPYVYALNNPIKYIDPNGREIVDAQGNIVYTHDKGWTKGVDEGTKRIGDAMMQTETGKEQFNKMVDSDTKIQLKISKESAGQDGEKMGEFAYDMNKVTIDKDGNAHIPSATITIFEGSIDAYLNNRNKKNNVISDFSVMGVAAFSASIDEYIGAVAGHEAEHATSQANINLHVNNKYAETVPNRIKTNILWESMFKKIKQ